MYENRIWQGKYGCSRFAPLSVCPPFSLPLGGVGLAAAAGLTLGERKIDRQSWPARYLFVALMYAGLLYAAAWRQGVGQPVSSQSDADGGKVEEPCLRWLASGAHAGTVVANGSPPCLCPSHSYRPV